MPAISLADLSNIVQKVIRPAVEDQLYAKTILWNMIGGFNPTAKTKLQQMPRLNAGILKTSLDNTSYLIPVVNGHSSGAVAIPENGTLVPGKPSTNAATVSARYMTGTFQITKQVLSIKEAGVAVKQLDFFMQQNTLAMILDLNRQGYGDGTGTIGTTAAIGTTTTALTFAPSLNGDIDYARYIPPGTNIIIGANASVTVVAYTAKNAVTISASQSWAAGATVKKADGAGNLASEMDGLQEAISNTLTYQNINPATDVSWVPGYVNTTAAGLVVTDMNTAFIQTNRFGSVKFIIMNASLFAKYGNSLTNNIRFEYKQVLGGGWSGLDYMGGQAQIVLDYDCPDDKLFFISPDAWTLGELLPFEWEQGTDGVLLRVQGTLNYEVTGTWFGNLGLFKRSANGMLANRS